MKILQLARRFVGDDWGGTETVIYETSKRLLSSGHQTELLCTMATASTTSDQFGDFQVQRFPHFYPYIGLNREAKRVLDKKGGSPFSFSLMRAIKNMPDLDLIHLHTGNRIGGIGRYMARKRNIPYVISLHGGVFDVPQEEASSWTAPTKGALDWGKILGLWVGSRRVLADASAILCVGYNESVAAQKQLPNNRVLYLPNGADTQRFSQGDGAAFRAKHNIPPDANVLLTVARIDGQKNQLLPVRMLPELLKIDPALHVLLVGNVTNPAYQARITQSIEENGVAGHTTLIPGIAADSQDIVDAYHAADIFLLPSIHEPFGIVILEAWSAGLPVIASKVGGIPHFVDDLQDGLLFDPGDENSFLQAVSAIVSDKSLAEKLAAKGTRKAQTQYDWDIITQRLIDLYQEVLRENTLRQ